jgi:uncharacterized protein
VHDRVCMCVFAKPPVPGQVKTRLIPLLRAPGAAELAAVSLQDTWNALTTLSWADLVLASTTGTQPECLSGAVEVWLQGEGDLGVRLENVCRRALKNYPYVIAIGADSPGLPLQFLEQARKALTKSDAVIGPSEDGGFYLLGLRSCPDGVLSGISWSTSRTCKETLARLQAANLTVQVLDPWFDLDTPADLQKLRTLLAENKVHAPITESFLKKQTLASSAPEPLKCSIVIPTLNERQHLPQTLASLKGHQWIHEVIVADGGSADGTREWLSAQSFVRVVGTPAGKGNQLNAGAQAASGEVLLFLHADCQIPCDAGARVTSRLQSPDVVGGCFEVRFSVRHPRSLNLVAAGINFRSRMTHSGTGDQGIFVRRTVFEKVGGFPNWPLFEDVELVSRIKKIGKFEVLRSHLLVSPRRHLARGVFRTVLLIYALRVGFWLGVSPFTLKKWFDDSRLSAQLPTVPEPTPERTS